MSTQHPKPLSCEELRARSDEWWEEYLAAHEGEGGPIVLAFALCAVSGGIVGFLIGLLVG